jgi:hypothetical protein
LEIPGQILRVSEGKPWAPERVDLLPKALEMTNFPALRTVSEIAYVKCGVPIIVASNRLDGVGFFIFLEDKVYIFSSRRTRLIEKITV